MTVEQQTALENLLGRTLRPAEELALSPLMVTRNDVEITKVVNGGMNDVVSTITVAALFNLFVGTGDYKTIKLAQLANNQLAVTSFAMFDDFDKYNGGVLDLSNPLIADQFAQMRDAGLISLSGYAALIAAATKKIRVYTVDEVSRALNIAEGRMVM